MARRSYDQYCGLAGALDLVGERWTLLIVRELMTGPKRYTDIAEALRGIGTSLLAQRLKRLESDGVITRTRWAAPAASTVYSLTESGEELGRALMPLVFWGLRYAVPEEPDEETRVEPAWSLLVFTHAIDPAALAGIDATYEVWVDGKAVILRVSDGRASIVLPDPGMQPDATIRIDAATVAALGSGRLSVSDAETAGRIEFDGDPVAIDALIATLASALGS